MSDAKHTQELGSVNPMSFTHQPENVADLEQHRFRRIQAKAEPAAPAMPEGNLEAILASLVKKALMDQEKANKKKKQGGGEGGGQAENSPKDPTIEMLFAQHFEKQQRWKLGGVLDEHTGEVERKVYEWMEGPRGCYWRVMSDVRARSLTTRWMGTQHPNKARSSTAASCLTTMMDMLSDDERCTIHQPSPDDDVAIMPVRNAYLYIERDGTIRAKKPTMGAGITYVVPAEIDWARVDADGIYTPQEPPAGSAWGSYLDLFMSDLGVRQLLQEATGSSLLPTTFERGFMLVGSGSNGKSTFLNALTALHPRHMSLSLKKLEGEFNLAKLGQGVTLAMSSENPSFIGPDAEEVLKALISRDIISARDPHQPLSSFRPRATLFFACNKAIQFTDRSKGLQTKLQIIPFMGYKNRRGQGVVRDYDKKVTKNAKELGVLLDWALIGAARLRQQDDQFSELPEAAAAVVKTVRIEADPVSSYLCQVDLQLETACESSKEAIYDDYVAMADRDNAKAVRSQEFWRAVKEYVQRELGGELQERQPSGGARYGKRVGRTVNVSIMGLQPTGWHWDTGVKLANPLPPVDEEGNFPEIPFP